MPAAAANVVGVSMLLGLPYANFGCKRDVCGLHNDILWPGAHTANMDDKNGGPNYLQAWRKFRRMTQQELADGIGTTKAVVSLLESGDRPLSAKWLRKIAPVLKTTPGHLLDHDPETLPTDIVDIWMHIEERDRARARSILETFRTGTDD